MILPPVLSAMAREALNCKKTTFTPRDIMKNKIYCIVLACLAFSSSTCLLADGFLLHAERQQKAIRSEDWNTAIKHTIGMIEDMDDNNMTSIGFFQLGGLYWLSGNHEKAVNALRKSISIMGRSEDIDMKMIVVTKKLLTRITESSSAPTAREKSALAEYIRQLARNAAIARNDLELAEERQAEILRHQLLMQRYDHEIAQIQRETQRMERAAKSSASQEYWRNTGKIFDSDNRPSDPRMRAEWDAAKRVYNIFE